MRPLVIAQQVTTWQMCVMTRGETYFANLGGDIKGYGVMAPGSLHDTGRLLADTARAFGDTAEALLLVPVLPGAGGEQMDTRPERWSAMEASALTAGWRVTGDHGAIRDNGWVTFRNLDDDRVIYMGVLTLMDQDRTPLFDLAADAETIIQRLVTYASVTGVVWRMTAGISGCMSLRKDRADRAEHQLVIGQAPHGPDQVCPDCPHTATERAEPWWRWDTCPPDVHGAGHMIWDRPLTAAERAAVDGRVVKFDIRAQFLAAMISGSYGWGEPHHRPRVPFDPDRAGFWKIASSGPLSLPGPPLVRNVDGGMTWVTTRVMQYLRDNGIEPMVYDSYTTATSSQWLKPWATKIRDALYAENQYLQDISDALKRTYTETNGMFATPGGSVARKDMHWTTVDVGTINMRVKLDHVHSAIGMWPCQVYHDAVWYPVEDREMFTALCLALGVKLKGRTSVGKFRYVSGETIPEFEARQEKRNAR